MTGTEAISNGVMAFKAPAQKNAATTLGWMVAILAVFFLGVSALARHYQVMPTASETVLSADLVISAVPPDAWPDVVPPAIAQDAWIVDLAYDERGTPAERWAITKGARAMNGMSMLLHQGALSFERWTGRVFPMDAAKESLLGERTPEGEIDLERTPPSGD